MNWERNHSRQWGCFLVGFFGRFEKGRLSASLLLLHLRQSYYLSFRQFYCLLLRRSLLRAMTTASLLIWAAERIPCPDSCPGSKAFCLQFFLSINFGGLGTLLHFTRLSAGPKNLSPGQGYFCYASPKSQYGPIRKSATNMAHL